MPPISECVPGAIGGTFQSQLFSSLVAAHIDYMPHLSRLKFHKTEVHRSPEVVIVAEGIPTLTDTKTRGGNIHYNQPGSRHYFSDIDSID